MAPLSTTTLNSNQQIHDSLDKPPIPQGDGSRRGSEASTSTSTTRTVVAETDYPSLASELDLSSCSRSSAGPHATPILEAQERGHRTGTVNHDL